MMCSYSEHVNKQINHITLFDFCGKRVNDVFFFKDSFYSLITILPRKYYMVCCFFSRHISSHVFFAIGGSGSGGLPRSCLRGRQETGGTIGCVAYICIIHVYI